MKTRIEKLKTFVKDHQEATIGICVASVLGGIVAVQADTIKDLKIEAAIYYGVICGYRKFVENNDLQSTLEAYAGT